MTRISVGILLTGLTAALALPAVPASAAPGGVADGARADGAHCAVNVETRASRCYGSFRQAIAAATGGRITDAPENPAAALASQSLEDRINAIGREAASGAAPQASVVLSIEYLPPDHRGQRHVLRSHRVRHRRGVRRAVQLCR